MADDGGVLGNLPNSRPGKRSTKRDPGRSRPAKAAKDAAAKAEASGAAAAKPPPAPRPKRASTPPPPPAPEPSGDVVGTVVRTAAGITIAGVKVAGAVTQELLRRLPRP
jgi:hypothetical protein